MTDDAARTEVPPVVPRRWVRGVQVGTSVFFGVVTVVMLVLWVRSYWRVDMIDNRVNFIFNSRSGFLIFSQGSNMGFMPNATEDWSFFSANTDGPTYRQFAFYQRPNSNGWILVIPYWMPTATSAVASVIAAWTVWSRPI
jgi:hypothetical protein